MSDEPTWDLAREGVPPGKLFSFEDDEQMRALKEIKVKLPVHQHIKLHSLKITQNRAISEVVKLALDEYFSRLEAPNEG